MAPKLTKRELERERALEQQQQQQQQQEEPPSANAYGLQPLATGAQPPVMMGDDAAAAMRGTATPLAVGLMHPSASPAPQQAVNVYQFGEHPPPEELGLVGGDSSDLSFYDGRRPGSPSAAMGKRGADEAFADATASMTGGSEGDWDSGKSKKKKPPGRSSQTPTSAAASSMAGSQDKSSKGLRHFSMRVCKKVEEKGRTNYNEVADELVREVLNPKVDPHTGVQETQFDEKNIRRRVYDALNVLMAMDIISKEKKEIRWKGLPCNAQHDIELLQREKRALEDSVAKKKEHLQELILQRVAFKRLIKRNAERDGGMDASTTDSDEPRVPLPFIVINTSSQTIIQCDMTEDRSDVFFNFSAPFQIGDDNEILKRLELQKATAAEMQELVPPELLRYVPPEAYLDGAPSHIAAHMGGAAVNGRGAAAQPGMVATPQHPQYMMHATGYPDATPTYAGVMPPPATSTASAKSNSLASALRA